MGCDCGIRAETEAEKKECEKSAELEASDQVSMFEQFDATNTKNPGSAIKGVRGVVQLVMCPGLSTSQSVVGVQIRIWIHKN